MLLRDSDVFRKSGMVFPVMPPSNQKGLNSVIVVGGGGREGPATLVLYFAWHSQVPCSWGATEGTWRWSRGSFADLRWTFFVHLRRGRRSGCDLARLMIYWGLPHVWFLLTTPFPNRFSRHVSQFHVSQRALLAFMNFPDEIAVVLYQQFPSIASSKSHVF
jgi:hypothetical protein